MIDREWLDKVTHVVTHANCPDGMASAILLNDVLDRPRITFATHNTPEYEALEAHEGMLFCDLTPPARRVREFVDVGAIVLDHHAKQAEIVEAFGARGRYASLTDEPGVSGAVLAFREVWQWCTTEGSGSWARALDFAKLAGIRDTWQTKHERWAEARAQSEALRFYPWPFFAKLHEPFQPKGHEDLTQLLAIGKVLVERSDRQVEKFVTQGSGKKTMRGTHVMIVATTHTSDIADAVGDVADVVIGFEYIGGESISLQLSMRSRGSYDVGAFCKSLDGGGHVNAAGARVPVNNGDLNPYEMIWKLVDDFERGL